MRADAEQDVALRSLVVLLLSAPRGNSDPVFTATYRWANHDIMWAQKVA